MTGALKIAISVSAAVLLVCIMPSCQSDGGYYPSGQPALRFSADTLSFDTIFSTVGSTTLWLSVYNPQKQTVLVDSVYLRSQGASGFRISVDALPGGKGCGNLEIPANDSVFVFVELTAAAQNSPTPVVLLDDIIFQQGNISQNVSLKACVQDAVVWKGKVLDVDTTLKAGLPYLIYDSLVVGKGKVLDVEEGVCFHFHDKAMFSVYGTVRVKGTLERPVIMRGDRLDWMFSNLKYDSYPGQWVGVYLAPESNGNVMEHVDIHGAYYGIIADSTLDASDTKLLLKDSKVGNMMYHAFYNVSSKVKVYNSLLYNSGSYTVLLVGGSTEIIHCTIANYQKLLNRDESSPALAIVNFTGDEDGKNIYQYPVRQANIINTVVYGSQENEVGFGLIEKAAHKIKFSNSLLKMEGKLDDSMGNNVKYNEDPLFVSSGDNYVFDFHVTSESPLLGRADTAYSKLCPLDLDGCGRLVDGQADIGAYRCPR